jgi:hypothetical protein
VSINVDTRVHINRRLNELRFGETKLSAPFCCRTSYRFCPQSNSSVEAALAIFQPSMVRTR